MPLFCIISLNSVASGVHHCVKVVEDVSVKKFTFAILSPNEFLVDYCNSLLYGMSNILLRRFQAIHAARLVTGTPKCDISLVLQQLHWLPICDSEWNLSSLSWSTRTQQPGTIVSVRRLPARCHHRAPSGSIIRQF